MGNGLNERVEEYPEFVKKILSIDFDEEEEGDEI